MFVPGQTARIHGPTITPFHDEMSPLGQAHQTPPASGTWGTASLANFWPIYLREPFVVAKAFWCNGATVGTDSIDIGVYRMTDPSTGRLDLIRSTGRVLSAGSANVVQATSTWRVAAANITTGVDSTDATSYQTASVTLKAGRLYLLSFVNTAADAAVISGISGGPTWTSRSSTQYNTTAHRVSIWSGVPTSDYTGTIVVSFGATQTGGRWSLNEFSGVDTTTNDGIVQQATGTGNSTTPLATLGAFGSANNATFGVNANTADSTTTPGSGFLELSDLSTTTTPASFLQTQWRVDNDTTSDGTITSGQWGAAAVEIQADTATPFVIPPSQVPDIYMAMTVTGTTATLIRHNATVPQATGRGHLVLTSQPWLASSCTPSSPAGNLRLPVAGFSLRSLIE